MVEVLLHLLMTSRKECNAFERSCDLPATDLDALRSDAIGVVVVDAVADGPAIIDRFLSGFRSLVLSVWCAMLL